MEKQRTAPFRDRLIVGLGLAAPAVDTEPNQFVVV
jgi:hypothetical protein